MFITKLVPGKCRVPTKNDFIIMVVIIKKMQIIIMYCDFDLDFSVLLFTFFKLS